MAYQPCRCSVTLLCSVCIIVFCTPLALSVLLPFMLYAPYPFNAPFLDCAFLLLRYASLYTPEFSYTMTTTYLFFVPHSYSLYCLCACNICNASACSLCTKFLHNSSSLSDHHHDSSTSLVVYHLFNITVCCLSGSLRLFVFSVTVELTFSVLVTGFNAHPAVNHLHEHLHPS
jgi:hypothetical protein